MVYMYGNTEFAINPIQQYKIFSKLKDINDEEDFLKRLDYEFLKSIIDYPFDDEELGDIMGSSLWGFLKEICGYDELLFNAKNFFNNGKSISDLKKDITETQVVLDEMCQIVKG